MKGLSMHTAARPRGDVLATAGSCARHGEDESAEPEPNYWRTKLTRM
jgi:hypothetical protein